MPVARQKTYGTRHVACPLNLIKFCQGDMVVVGHAIFELSWGGNVLIQFFWIKRVL